MLNEHCLHFTPHPPPPPIFWKRYVHDTCTAISKDHLNEFHEHLNSIEPSIKFTYETENDNKIPFLDTEILRHNDGSISTTVHRKSTHTDKYLAFSSHHPLAQKLSVVNTLKSRAKTHCTFENDRIIEEKKISEALILNNYPTSVINW